MTEDKKEEIKLKYINFKNMSDIEKQRFLEEVSQLADVIRGPQTFTDKKEQSNAERLCRIMGFKKPEEK